MLIFIMQNVTFKPFLLSVILLNVVAPLGRLATFNKLKQIKNFPLFILALELHLK
jgi:hypothetical protein